MLMVLDLPDWMLDPEYNWLTEEYITQNGKYPEKPDIFGSLEEDERFKEFDFGEIPMISTDDIEAGDILIFFDGDGPDIFYRFNEDDISEYQSEDRCFLAHGVIIKPPWKMLKIHCAFSDTDGKCLINDPDMKNPGTDENGFCICENDPDPLSTCINYVEK